MAKLRIKILINRIELYFYKNNKFIPKSIQKIWLRRINENIINLTSELKEKYII